MYNFECRFDSCWGLFYTIKLCGLFLFRSRSNKSCFRYNWWKEEKTRVRNSTKRNKTHLILLKSGKLLYRYKIRGTSSSGGRLSGYCSSRRTSTETLKRNILEKCVTIWISRSAHRTPNFTNPAFQFPQFKVGLQSGFFLSIITSYIGIFGCILILIWNFYLEKILKK